MVRPGRSTGRTLASVGLQVSPICPRVRRAVGASRWIESCRCGAVAIRSDAPRLGAARSLTAMSTWWWSIRSLLKAPNLFEEGGEDADYDARRSQASRSNSGYCQRRRLGEGHERQSE